MWISPFPNQLDPCLTLRNLEQRQVDRLPVKSEWWMSGTNCKRKSMTIRPECTTCLRLLYLYILQTWRWLTVEFQTPHRHLATSTTKIKGQRLRGMRSLVPRNAWSRALHSSTWHITWAAEFETGAWTKNKDTSVRRCNHVDPNAPRIRTSLPVFPRPTKVSGHCSTSSRLSRRWMVASNPAAETTPLPGQRGEASYDTKKYVQICTDNYKYLNNG